MADDRSPLTAYVTGILRHPAIASTTRSINARTGRSSGSLAK